MRCKIPANDLAQKLDSTICRYKGHPYLIRVDGYELHLYEITNTKKRAGIIKPTDPDFDIAGLPLGYVQKTTADSMSVVYLSRTPIRRTKQGLDTKALRLKSNHGSKSLTGVPPNSVVYTEGFVEMVLNKYPSLDFCLKTLRDLWAKDNACNAETAVNRNVAMSIDKVGIIKVFYKTEYVGWIEPDKFVVHVPANDMSWVVSKFLSHELSWEID